MAKTEHFHARFEPQTEFALSLIAQQRKQKKVAVVEEALLEQAKRIALEELGQHFNALYHPSEGVRMLNLFACPGFKATTAQDELRAFVLAHKQFFYADDKATTPQLDYVDVLWDRVQHYFELWRDKRHEDHYVAAEAMAEALKKTKIKPPKYGPGK
jgi:hypothetical protein